MTKQCKYIKPDGNQCQSFAIQGFDFCFSHCPDPEVKKAKHQAVVKGGQSEGYKSLKLNLRPVSVKNTEDVIDFLNETINLLRSGQISPKVANCLAYLTNQLQRAIEFQKLSIVERIITERKIISEQK